MELGLNEMLSPRTPEQRLYKIIFKINDLKDPIDEFYNYYGIRGSKASDMLDGALMALSNRNNPEQFFQAAHSLREILYSLMSNKDGSFRHKRKNMGASSSKVQNKVKQDFPRFNIKKIREGIYQDLNDIAHHSPWGTDDHLRELIKLIEKFVEEMSRATWRPTQTKSSPPTVKRFNSTSLVESIIGKGPPIS